MPEPPASDHRLDELDAFAEEGATVSPIDPRVEDLDVFAGGGTADLPPQEVEPPAENPTTDQPTVALGSFPGSQPTLGYDLPPSGEIPEELLDHPRYQIIRLLGAGGMGSVYQAEHRMMGRPVALKVLSRELTASPNAALRFDREVRTAAQLHHPNIVDAYDADQAGDLHFLAMEFVEGTSLGEHVRRGGPLPPADACEYVRHAALDLQD